MLTAHHSARPRTGELGPWAVLRRLAGATGGPRCELCGAPLPAPHRHLLGRERELACACDACALLLGAAGSGRYAALPRSPRRLAAWRPGEAEWGALGIPIGLAYILRREDGTMRAFYPSPAGATEAPLEAEAWERMIAGSGALAAMAPEVEALLAQRAREPHEYFLAPLDRCYELTALLRLHWRGFSGGVEVWRRLESFFADLGAAADENGEASAPASAPAENAGAGAAGAADAAEAAS